MPDQATIPAENTRKKCLQVILRFAAPPENPALLALAWWLRNPSQEADRRMEGLNQTGAAFLQSGVSRIDRPWPSGTPVQDWLKAEAEIDSELEQR
jgi:hypothetical protein